MDRKTFGRARRLTASVAFDTILVLGSFALPVSAFLFASGCGVSPLLGLLALPICLIVGGVRFAKRASFSRGLTRATSFALLGLLLAGGVSWFIPDLRMIDRGFGAGFKVRMAVTVGLGNLQRIAMEAIDRNRVALDDPSVGEVELPGQWNNYTKPAETPDYLRDLNRFAANKVRLTKRHGGYCMDIYVGGGFLEYKAILVGPPGFSPDHNPGFQQKWADGIYFVSN